MAMALMLHTISWADNGLKIQLNGVAEMEVTAMDTEGRAVTKRVDGGKGYSRQQDHLHDYVPQSG